MLNYPSLMLSVSAIIDDAEAVGADLKRTNVRNIKKLTITSIPWIYSEHAHLLCSFTPEKGQIPPLWSCLSPQFLMILRQSALTCIKLMLEIWKKLTITSILWIYSEHAHHLYSFMPELGEPFLFEVVCLCDYWWCRGSQHWFAKSLCRRYEKN